MVLADDDIESANDLSIMMKKISHAAKMSQRNSVRCKARLVKKCAKMSVQDLERLAVLKRCGLLVAEEPVHEPMTSTASSSSAAVASPQRKRKSSVEMLKKLADVVSKSGRGDVLSCVTDLQELLKQEEAQRHREGDPAAGKQHVMPAVGAERGGRGVLRDHDVPVVVDTAMEEAGDDKEDAEIEHDV